VAEITGAKIRTGSAGWVREYDADGARDVHLEGAGHTNPWDTCPECHRPPSFRERLALWLFETVRGRRP